MNPLMCKFLFLLALTLTQQQHSNTSLLECVAAFALCASFALYPHAHRNTASFRRISAHNNKSCPICLDDISDGVILRSCAHAVCLECAFGFLTHCIGDVQKYPLKCFAHNCKTLIQSDVVRHILDAHSDDEEEQRLLSKYVRAFFADHLDSAARTHRLRECTVRECDAQKPASARPPLRAQAQCASARLRCAQLCFQCGVNVGSTIARCAEMCFARCACASKCRYWNWITSSPSRFACSATALRRVPHNGVLSRRRAVAQCVRCERQREWRVQIGQSGRRGGQGLGAVGEREDEAVDAAECLSKVLALRHCGGKGERLQSYDASGVCRQSGGEWHALLLYVRRGAVLGWIS